MGGSMNQKIVAWAHGHLKKSIGRGQCWDLPHQALLHAGARSSTTVGRDDDYVWGTEIPLTAVIPGDILQLRDYVVTTTTSSRTTWPYGSSSEPPEAVPARRPHHSAIVAAVGSGVFTIFEQHVKPGGDYVQQHTLPIRPSTTVTTEHKVLKTTTGGRVAATVITTVTISISGKIWAYRPVPASGRRD